MSIELLKQLIAAESTLEYGELRCAEILAGFFRNANLNPQLDIWNKNRANITMQLGAENRGKKKLLFLCHLDVVPAEKKFWKTSPFEPVEKDGRLYGRGSCDMKAGISAIAQAFVEIAEQNIELPFDCVFAATAGEETDGQGIERFIKSIDSSEFFGAVVCEPTDFELVCAHRGILWLKIITKGRTAHGSMPHLGINAINCMRRFLDEFDRYDFSSLQDEMLCRGGKSINKITGGAATNVVPDLCTAQIDMRTLPAHNHKQIISDIKNIFEKIKSDNQEFSAELEIIKDVQAMKTNADCNFVRQMKAITKTDKVSIAGYCTDAPYISKLGIPTVITGPGSSENCHRPDEFVALKDIAKAAEFYKNIMLKLSE